MTVIYSEPLPRSILPCAASEVKELFEEYEAGETPEALLVKDFDKVCSDV